MGLLSKLRAWIAGTAGDDESAAPSTDPGDEEPTESGESGESGEKAEATGLDPSAATETRTAATDDAVDALRDVRRSQDGSPVEEGADEAAGDAGGDERDAS